MNSEPLVVGHSLKLIPDVLHHHSSCVQESISSGATWYCCRFNDLNSIRIILAVSQLPIVSGQ